MGSASGRCGCTARSSPGVPSRRWEPGRSLLDVNPATLRNWIEEAEGTEGTRPAAASTRSGDGEEVRALKKRVAELERANEILTTASGSFAQAELDRRFR